MPRHFIEVRSISDWQSRLGNPEIHWRRGYSAMELAIAWTLCKDDPRGMPQAVAALLDSNEALAQSTVSVAIPELRTSLPGGSTPSQTDLWALLQNAKGAISLSVEGKAREPFGETVERWLGAPRPDRQPLPGRLARIEYLTQRLGLDTSTIGPLRYQLLHRSVAALIEAEQWGASTAVMLVQRFVDQRPRDNRSWSDFQAFTASLGAEAQPGTLVRANVPGSQPLYLAWLDSPVASDAQVVAAMTSTPVHATPNRNGFEALCQRATIENWCWRLTCTTCGCMHFRYGLLELALGKHPDNANWSTRSRASAERLRREVGADAMTLSIDWQRAAAAIASRARLAALASNARFPDWLGYLGVVLSFCHDAELENRALTKAWASQLSEMLAANSALRRRLQERAAGTSVLLLSELEEVERELQHPTDFRR